MIAGTLLYSLFAVWTMFQAPKPEQRAGPVTPLNKFAADSGAVHAQLVLNVSEFQVAWQQAWQEVEASRMKLQGIGLGDRQSWTLVHCHPDGEPDGALPPGKAPPGKNARDSVRKANVSNVLIQSRNSWFAVCPSWTLDPTDDIQDIPGGRDGILTESVRKRIADLRFRLINKLQAASGDFPKDGWLSGQIVRFRIDARDFDGALSTAEFCGADAWWCLALRGYVHNQRGERELAAKAYAQMMTKMTPIQACKWDDLSVFMPDADQKAYSLMTCAAQDSLNRRFWWLADPMFRIAGNERFVEQQTRRVESAIRSSMAQDEWHPWDEKYGGDALQTLTARYGLASHYAWFGDSLDMSHTSIYLEQRGTVGTPPYTTYEYQPNRVHTAAAWATTLSPFDATETSWVLNKHEAATGELAKDWWPLEHFTPLRPMMQLPEGQIAQFRRQSEAVVAVALQTQHPAIPPTSIFDVLMLRSTGPTKIDSLAQVAVRAPQPLAIRAIVPITPSIISIEALGANGTNFDARTRFGIVPPAPLDSLRDGDLELSDIALIDISSDSVRILEPNEDLLDHMLSTVHLDNAHRRIGLYWESYGVTPLDPVTVTVRIGNIVEVGTLQRIGIALRMSQDPNRSITQSWKEPDANRGTRTLEGSVPVQQRTVSLNLSQLLPGDYALEISIQRPSGKVATKTRRFTVEK